MNDIWYVSVLLLSIFICSCTQIALKKNASKAYSGIRIYLNKTVIISNAIFVGATLVSVMLYRYIQLSTAALLQSSSYIFVVILSAIFLKENISKRKVIGMVLILSGIAVYAVFDGRI